MAAGDSGDFNPMRAASKSRNSASVMPMFIWVSVVSEGEGGGAGGATLQQRTGMGTGGTAAGTGPLMTMWSCL